MCGRLSTPQGVSDSLLTRASRLCVLVGVLVFATVGTPHAATIEHVVHSDPSQLIALYAPSGVSDSSDWVVPAEPSKLPTRSIKLIIPSGQRVHTVRTRILAKSIVDLPESYKAVPGAAVPGAAVPGSALSGSQQDILSPTADIVYQGAWRGHQIVFLRLHPFVASQGQLELVEDLQLVLQTRPASERPLQRARYNPRLDREDREMIRAFVDNPQAMQRTVQVSEKAVNIPGPFRPAALPDLEGSDVEYVIVTSAALAPSFQALADWKTRRGVPTVVQTIESIEANYRHGADRGETIRIYLQDAYTKWSLQWVLLGGDTETIPVRFLTSTFGVTEPEDIPCDLYYSGLDGTWNANGNAVWGESPATVGDPDPDGGDLLSEVHLSRGTVSTPAEVNVFVQKVITYETPNDPTYQNRTLFLAEVLFPTNWSGGNNITMDGGQLSQGLIDARFPPGMNPDRRYETFASYPGSQTLNHASSLADLNSGYNMVNHMGHGFRYNMSVSNLSIVNADADALVNGDRLFVLNVLNCTSLAFDFSCLGEHYMGNPAGGAVAVLGASRSAYPLPSKDYQDDYYDLLLNQNVWRMGELFTRSRLDQVAAAATESAHRWTHYIYNALGDPELNIYTDLPKALTVSHASSVGLGAQAILLHVEESPGVAAVGAKVCLQKDADDYEVGFTNASGDVTLQFTAESAGSIDVTVTGRNLRTHLGTIAVTTGATSYVHLNGVTLDDDTVGGSNGNGNSIIDAGETLDLSLTLINDGLAPATTVTGSLTVTDAYVTVTAGVITASNVSAGGVKIADAPVRLVISPNAPDGHVFQMDLALSDGVGGNWNDTLRREIHAPKLELVALEIQDNVTGNGNGLVDEAETFNLRVHLKNFGTGQVDGLTAVLQSTSPFVLQVNQGNSNYSAIAPVTEVTNSTAFQLFANFVDGTIVNMTLTDSWGRVSVLPFDFQRPSVPANLALDPSISPTSIVARWTPVADNDLKGYHVYRGATPNGPWIRATLDATTSSYYEDAGLLASTRYYYQLKSLDQSGNESLASATVVTSTNPPQLTGWPVNMAGESSSSTGLGDLDGDGLMEVVQGNSKLYAWHANGQEILDADSDAETWGLFQNQTSITAAAVALGELDGTAGLEVVSCNWATNEVFAVDGDGTLLWTRSPANGGVVGFWGAPTIADVDSDGRSEVFATSKDGHLYAWHSDGTPLIASNADGTFALIDAWNRSSVSIGNLDSDFELEIVFVDLLGEIYAWNPDGTSLPGFPILTGQIFYNSPVIGDVDGDGTMEIVAVAQSGAPNVHVIRGDGTELPGFPFLVTQESGALSPSPALADLDLDGKLEILIGSNSWNTFISQLVILKSDATHYPGWPKILSTDSESSPIVADFDADGSPDIVYGGQGGVLRGWSHDGQELAGFPLSIGDFVRSTPAAADIDGDGDIDLVFAGWDKNLYIWDLVAAYDPALAQWPTYLHDAGRTGNYGYIVRDATDTSHLPAVPSKLSLVQNYPNPFNPLTRIGFGLPDGVTSIVQLNIYDVRGRHVRELLNSSHRPGQYEVIWNGRDDQQQGLGSGVYFYRLRWNDETLTRSMLLMK